jgi:aryl-alcohol dehydrogenase-like predicted oxidoreductase
MQRKLGRSGIEVSAMGFGAWAIGGPWTIFGSPAGWGEVDDDESVQAIHAALEAGITFFDTAANYGAGHSERILARALAGRRDEVVIATKFGYAVFEDERAVGAYDGDTKQSDVVSRLAADCEASLRRLNIDTIDLYQFHINEFPPERAGEVRDALEDLVKAGKIRAYAWSTDNPDGARVFAQGEHCTAVQHNMNVIHDSPAVLAVCDAFNLASINRGPLGMGLLTGKYTKDTTWATNDVRTGEWFQRDFLGPIMDNLPAIREVLTSSGRTLAQGALAWLWARSPHTIPIPGIRTVKQAQENAAAMDFGPLTADQMQAIESLLGRDG